MQAAVEKFEDELDVTKLLPKLRASNDLLKGLLRPEQIKLLGYTEGCVVTIKKKKRKSESDLKAKESSTSFSEKSSDDEDVFEDALESEKQPDLAYQRAILKRIPVDVSKESEQLLRLAKRENVF